MSSIMAKLLDKVNKDRDAGADDVLEQVHAVMHLVRAQQYRGAQAQPGAVTHMEGKALDFFARQPAATQSELAAHSGRDKGQLARLVAGLRERGLLQAQADADDRRSVRLQLTAEGQSALQALRRQRRRLAAVAVRGFSDAERQQLSTWLARVHANLQQAGED
jgi:DNA-binding MarR family transcriptional regulator